MSQADTKKILERVEGLSRDEKAYVVDQILQSIHDINVEIENKWIKVAEKRLTQIREGNVSMKSEEDLFADIERRYKG